MSDYYYCRRVLHHAGLARWESAVLMAVPAGSPLAGITMKALFVPSAVPFVLLNC